MLVLSRKKDERIVIDPDGLNIVVKVTKIHGGRDGSEVRIGIEAPRDLLVMRGELLDAPARKGA